MNFLVTGGSRGIGASIVLEAAREGHGVAFTYLSHQEQAADVERQARGGRAAQVKAYQVNVGCSTAVEQAGDQMLDDFGTIDVVVSNAGINRPNLLVHMSDEEWDEVVRTNLTGAFSLARQFLPSMMTQRFGRFILISSMGHRGITGQANYCASKAGLHGLAWAIAKEYGRRGVTANVVVPGLFDTDMTRAGLSATNKEFWGQYCPMARMGALSEVSKVVVFLASEGAAFINGQEIPVNGGLDWAP